MSHEIVKSIKRKKVQENWMEILELRSTINENKKFTTRAQQ